MTEEKDAHGMLRLNDRAQTQERELPVPYQNHDHILREKVKCKLEELRARARERLTQSAEPVTVKESQTTNTAQQVSSEDETVDFFCYDPDKAKKKEPHTAVQDTGSDTVIHIKEEVEGYNVLVPGKAVNREVDATLLFVPSDFPVPLMRTVPRRMKPRFLEDEGLFVCDKPQVPWKMINKMENRLIEQEKGQRWFGENGCMIALPEPIQKYWKCKVDFPFPNQSPGLSTVYTRPVIWGPSVTSTECCEGMWQLDLNLLGLVFTHHPLFSVEHVLAQRLLELCEHYEAREIAGTYTSLQDKLRGLKKSEITLLKKSETEPPSSKLKELRQEIRKTSAALDMERQADLTLARKIVTAWKRIKTLRAKNGFVSTTVKLQMLRVKIEDIDSSANGDGEDSRTMVYTQGDGTIKQHFLLKELKRNEKEELTHIEGSASQRTEHSDLIPVLTRSSVITPTSSCPPNITKGFTGERKQKKPQEEHVKEGFPPSEEAMVLAEDDEKVRRYELEHHRISVNVFYNRKHVSTSEPAVFDNDFGVDIQQVFHMQIVHSPEDIMLEICEMVRGKSTVIANVYLPIPNRNMLSSSTGVERSEFSCEQVVRSYYKGVGSNLPFKVDEEEPSVCLLTSGRLLYGVSWAVDDAGFPMAPALAPRNPRFTRPMARWDNISRLQWIRELQFDPNHPANTELAELLKETSERGDEEPGYFRLRAPEEEFDFTTDEELDKSKRFTLLQLRSSHALGKVSSDPVPLHDTNITEEMLEKYTGPSNVSLENGDPITYQRSRSLHYIEKLLSLAREKLLKIKKRYKFSDIIKEYQDQDSVMNFNWDMFRRARPMNPKRVVRENAPSTTLVGRDLKIHISINNARGLPVRLEAHLREMHARGSCCGLQNSRHSNKGSTAKVMSQAQVQPFMEVRFQERTYESSVEQGPSPCWREEFTLQFKSKEGDYSQEGLSKMQDNIVINVFDELSFQVNESSSYRGCGTQLFSGRQWLGSVTIPFRALLQQSKVCETLSICSPAMLLGYTWPEEPRFAEEGTEVLLDRDNSYLDVFITLDPTISLSPGTTTRDEDQRPLWLFPTDEEDGVLEWTYEFDKECRAAAGGRKCVITTVINIEGRLVLATRFFRPLPPPEDVLQVLPEHRPLSVLERVAAFVSLIPVLPFPSDIGDCGDMWFTSEQCLELAMGNRVSLAVLLCNFFHHLNSEAWLVLGTSVVEGETAYVLNMQHTSYVLWNPGNGKHYGSSDAYCPLRSVDCLVSGQNVWFNSQRTTKTALLNFDTADSATWRPLFPSDLERESSLMPIKISYHPPDLDVIRHLQKKMEVQVKNCVMDWRIPHPTRWSHRCSAMLSLVLPHLENMPVSSSSIETEIDKLFNTLEDYKVTGFPIHMAYQDMDSVIEAVYNTSIHCTEIPGTEFALAAYIHPYPNHILSVWIFLATLVKHQNGVFYTPSDRDY